MTFSIGNFEIGSGRAFVIAEIGNNHNGDFDLAIDMVDQACSAGADCVKFQMRHLDEVYRGRTLHGQGDDLGTEYIVDLLRRFELTVEQHAKIFEYVTQNNIVYMCTPWDKSSVHVLESFGVQAYKVASADLTNEPLIDHLISTGKPLILSTGMSKTEEVKATVQKLNKAGTDFALLHCNSTYPAPFHDVNLKWMSSLREIHPLIGYSGHERGTAVSLAAVAFEACIIERHFTMDRLMEGPDHAASLEPSEFGQLTKGIREVEAALGDGGTRRLSQGEMINRENLGKSLVAAQPIRSGTVIEPCHLMVRSPGQGLSPQRTSELVGRKLSRDMDTEDFFFPSDIDDRKYEPGKYQFSRPWGVPVRYHDFTSYADRIQPDIWEFHLSYSDMDIDVGDYLVETYPSGLVVHAPELFAESHLMDLATPDEVYRKHSLDETQRVVDITRELNVYFPVTKTPLIVANIGGFTMDAPLPPIEVQEYYWRFGESIRALDTDGVEIILRPWLHSLGTLEAKDTKTCLYQATKY